MLDTHLDLAFSTFFWFVIFTIERITLSKEDADLV